MINVRSLSTYEREYREYILRNNKNHLTYKKFITVISCKDDSNGKYYFVFNPCFFHVNISQKLLSLQKQRTDGYLYIMTSIVGSEDYHHFPHGQSACWLSGGGHLCLFAIVPAAVLESLSSSVSPLSSSLYPSSCVSQLSQSEKRKIILNQ